MDVVNLVFSLLSVAISAATVIISEIKKAELPRIHAPLLVSSSLVFILNIVFIFVLGERPVEVFCLGSAFFFMSAMPFTSSRLKIYVFAVLVCASLLLSVCSSDFVVLLLISYFALSWIVEFRRINADEAFSDIIVPITTNYLLICVYAFIPILISVLSIILSRWNGLFSELLDCLLLVLSWLLYSFAFSKIIWGSEINIHIDFKERVKAFLTFQSCPKVQYSNKEPSSHPFMPELYEKFCRYLAASEDYLKPDLKITQVASSLLTNKTYLSRSISENSGNTFPNIINSHRVKYAIKCFQEDPHLKIVELARMSGFSTDSHFSLAFRKEMGVSPREWICNYKYEHLLND